ncbi:MAG: glycosyltransferase family A protein [Patulibacter sp.]
MPSPSSPSPQTLPVTVVIPAYNREGLVGRAVASALAQSPNPPDEILVVDDASSDETAAAAELAGATVIRHTTNGGEGAARNTAIRAARNEWVALLDSDDEWLPHHLATLWHQRRNHVLVASSAITEGAPNGENYLVGHRSTKPAILTSPIQVILPFNPIPASGVLAHAPTVLSAGGFRPLNRCADLDMWIRMLERGTALLSPTPGYRYHLHADQVSGDQRLMREARRDLVASYRGATWWDPSLLKTLDAYSAWDAARQRSRHPLGWVPPLVREVTARPKSAIDIAKLLRSRRLLKRRMRDATSRRRN